MLVEVGRGGFWQSEDAKPTSLTKTRPPVKHFGYISVAFFLSSRETGGERRGRRQASPCNYIRGQQSLAAYRYYQQLVLETDQEIQRQMLELEAAATHWARSRSEPIASIPTTGTRAACSIFAANSIGSLELT